MFLEPLFLDAVVKDQQHRFEDVGLGFLEGRRVDAEVDRQTR